MVLIFSSFIRILFVLMWLRFKILKMLQKEYFFPVANALATNPGNAGHGKSKRRLENKNESLKL